MDLKLYDFSAVEEFGISKIKLNLLEVASVSSPTTSRLETIVNKVVKFLITDYNSNAFDPTYGSKWTTYTQIRESYIPQFILLINSDISRCISYIRNSEVSLPNTIEKLSTIKFNGLEYSTPTFESTTRILVNITIYTNFNNKALFTLTN